MRFQEPFNSAWVIAVAIVGLALLLVAIARGADDTSAYACNPAGTEAWLYGRLILNAPESSACANFTLQSTNPPGRVDGDLWLVHTADIHRLCYRRNDADYCLSMEEIP